MLTQCLEELYTGRSRSHSEEFYEQCLHEMESEQVAPQVLAIAKQSHCVELLPKDFMNGVRRLHQRTVGQNLYIRLHQQQVFTELNHHEIPAITLKGVVFAERYFGDITARPTSDIDILVTQHDLERAIECLKLQGFTGPHDYNPLHFHCVMSKPIHPGHGVLNIELHWSLVHVNNARPEWNAFWENAKAIEGYQYIKELSVEDTFYAICLHGANHKLTSLKYFLDVAQVIYTHGTEFDYHRLFQTCMRDGTLRRVKAVLNIVYAEFPGLHGCKPLPYRSAGGWRFSRAILNVPVLTPDSWRLRFRIVREWFWPLREVAVWHLRNDEGLTHSNVYVRFYRQRLFNLLKIFRLHTRNTEETRLNV